MKHLLILLVLVACGHEHPLTEHQHDHTHDHDHQHEHGLPDHDHHYLFPQGLPFAYILSVDPPLYGPGAWKSGVLRKSRYEIEGAPEVVYIEFSKEPKNLTLTDIFYPGEESTPVDSWGLLIRYSDWEYTNRARVYTNCSDPEHEGFIAFRLDWDTGSAHLYYQCPEEE